MANKTTIKTPVPGTFYRRPSPDEDPYIDEGDRVSDGQVIGLVEVMKNFNEVKADRDGKKNHHRYCPSAEARVIVRQHADGLALRVVPSEATRTHHHAQRRAQHEVEGRGASCVAP